MIQKQSEYIFRLSKELLFIRLKLGVVWKRREYTWSLHMTLHDSLHGLRHNACSLNLPILCHFSEAFGKCLFKSTSCPTVPAADGILSAFWIAWPSLYLFFPLSSTFLFHLLIYQCLFSVLRQQKTFILLFILLDIDKSWTPCALQWPNFIEGNKERSKPELRVCVVFSSLVCTYMDAFENIVFTHTNSIVKVYPITQNCKKKKQFEITLVAIVCHLW